MKDFVKKLPLVFSAAALVGAATLYAVVFMRPLSGGAGGGETAEEKNGGLSVAAADGIVFVNVDSLIRGYDMYFDLRSEFETKTKAKENDFAARRKRFEGEVRDYQEKIEKGLVTRSQAQELQERLQRKEQDMVQLGQQMQAELAEEEAVMLRQIQNNIQKYIRQYNADKGYRLILSNPNGNVLLYGDPALNITEDVLAGLNREYIGERKK